jgi:hypothetical protein
LDSKVRKELVQVPQANGKIQKSFTLPILTNSNSRTSLAQNQTSLNNINHAENE